MSGGGLAASSNEYLGNNGAGIFIQSGGTNAIGALGSTSTGSLYLGYNFGSIGSYSLSGSGLLSAGYEYLGTQGTGTFTQSGGTNVVSSAFSLGAGGTYNLNGGALLVPGIQGGGAFNLGGGILLASASFSSSQAMTLTGSGGNGNINTGGYPVILSGVLSGTGRLNLSGAGILTLTASNTYSGGTAVSSSTLQVGSGGSGEYLTSPSVSLNGSAALVFNFSDALTYGGVISGNGGLTQIGRGHPGLAGQQHLQRRYHGLRRYAPGRQRRQRRISGQSQRQPGQ